MVAVGRGTDGKKKQREKKNKHKKYSVNNGKDFHGLPLHKNQSHSGWAGPAAAAQEKNIENSSNA